MFGTIQKNCRKTKKANILVYMGVLMLVSMLFGCGKKGISKIADPEATVKKHLNKKYEREFEILTLDKENVGHNFANYVYQGTACVAGESDVFEFTLTDKYTMKDNYPSILYAEQIQCEVKALFDSYGFALEEAQWKYIQKSERYLEYETYKANWNLMFHCSIGEEIGGMEEKINNLYSLAMQLKDCGFYFYISAEVFGTAEYLMCADGIEMISAQEWSRRTMTE